MTGFFILFGFIVASVCLLLLVNWYLRLVAIAFAASVSWGLAVLLVPFGSLGFIVSRWRNGGKEAFRELVLVSTAVAIGVGLFLGGFVSRMRTRVIHQSPAVYVASSAEATPEPTSVPDELTAEQKDPAVTARAISSTLPQQAPSMTDGHPGHPSEPDDNARQPREWTDSTGVFQVTATLIQVEDSRVRLLRKDGQEILVPIDCLSVADQEYVSSCGKSSDLRE